MKTCPCCGNSKKYGKQEKRQLCNELEEIMGWKENVVYYNALNQGRLIQLLERLKK